MNALHCVATRQHFLTGMVQRGKCANLGGLTKISTPAVARVGKVETEMQKNVTEDLANSSVNFHRNLEAFWELPRARLLRCDLLNSQAS